jgi:hypothetical protein
MRKLTYVKMIFSVIVLLCAVPQEGHAQKRYAAFIHGFSFGDDRPKGVKDGEMCEIPFEKPACRISFESAGAR